ncbi:gp16 family protein [Pseudoalteromonas piscicida]|uniref:Regulatory protein GemA n=1 Tax=Pseudoalteromonas piscicida TaxID=43662 RepID=A0AAD0W317_PSEO7|nr:regulatory protein GemA [Pseudoalteromonas piscicida]ASD67687.1 GemA protein [Pseudoalteromonas piscicida]AXR01609.1 regulatory protein GemA [Pseudoalteromonas piscicida]
MYLSKSRYIQLIHIAKGQLAWDDELYRQVLTGLTKKKSCKDMNAGELKKVLDHMKDKGFKVEVKKSGKGRNSPITRDKEPKDKTPLDKLRQVWIEMAHAGLLRDGSEQALLSWAKGQAKRFNKGVAVERLEWLQPSMLHSLIEQLKQWRKRLEVEHG